LSVSQAACEHNSWYFSITEALLLGEPSLNKVRNTTEPIKFNLIALNWLYLEVRAKNEKLVKNEEIFPKVSLVVSATK